MIYYNIRPNIFAKYNVFIYEPIIMKFHNRRVHFLYFSYIIHIKKKKNYKNIIR